MDKETRDWIDLIIIDVRGLREEIKDLNKKVTNDLMHRLPYWVTLMISAMAMIIGGLVVKLL